MLIAKAKKNENGEIIRTQSLKDHTLSVSEIAAKSAEKTGFSNLSRLVGLLHDIGKAKPSFQNYIMDDNAVRGSVIHSRAGALWLFRTVFSNEAGDCRIPYAGDMKALKLTVQVAAMSILGHHTGPPDVVDPMSYDYLQTKKAFSDDEDEDAFNGFFREVIPEEAVLQVFDKAVNEVSMFLDSRIGEATKRYAADDSVGKRYRLAFRGFLGELISSYLVDADRRMSQEWETEKSIGYVPPDWEKLEAKLDHHLAGMKNDTVIGKMRQKLSDNLYAEGSNEQGLYKLWAPTGFGKTLGSIRYGIRQAETHGLSRIIYVIPYTSIIDQTAKEFRSIFGDDCVLEHHSNVYFSDDEEGKEQLSKYEQAQQVWDKPIIVTTMVRFLEIYFSMRNTELRRLSFLTDSVIVFDEIQTLPQRCVYPFYLASEFLRGIGSSTLLLCSATIPAFENEPFKLRCDGMLGGLTDADELVLRRTEIKDISYTQNTDGEMWRKYAARELVEEVFQRKGRTNLIIHNTKRAAELTYSEIEKSAPPTAKKFLLTTNLCPEHRRKLIEEIRWFLRDSCEDEVYIVSTQLIEAGVDISVDVVFRSYAGLDSIIQAAGRCNRHGNGDTRSPVYVFWSADENVGGVGLRDIKASQDAYRSLVKAYQGQLDMQGTKAIDLFYQYKAANAPARVKEYVYPDNENSIFKDLSKKMDVKTTDGLMLTTPFSRIGENFRVIDNAEQVSVVVPFDKNATTIISDLQKASLDASMLSVALRKAQRYTVTFFKNQLGGANNIYQVNGMYFAREYDTVFGLKPSVEGKALFA